MLGDRLDERALESSQRAPVDACAATSNTLAIQATLRSVWAGSDLLPRNAIPIAPALLATGNDPKNLREGQEAFQSAPRVKPRIR